MTNQKNYDVIVIGAGNAGLSAALRLSTKGCKVLVLERHNIPGGFASSFRRGRFEWDASLHEFCDYGTNEAPGDVKKLFEEYQIHRWIDWTTIPDSYRVITLDENKIDASMPWGEKAYIDQMELLVPGSRKAITKLFALGKETVEAQAYAASKGGKVESSYMVKNFPNYVKAGSYSVKQVMDAVKLPLKAQYIFSGYWCYLGVPMNEMNWQHYGSMFYRYVTRGIVIPTKTSHNISLALTERIRDLGSDIWLNSPVKRVLIENNEISGVELDTGKVIKCKHVIANTSPNKLFGSMIDKQYVPQVDIKTVNARTLGVRGFNVYLGLNKSPKELGIKDYTFLVYNNADSKVVGKKLVADTERNIQMIAVTVPSFVSDKMSPEGTTVMEITSFFLNNSWDNVKPEEYDDEKNRVALQCIEMFEKATGIKIKEYIEEISIAAPQTFARYGSHPHGVMYGYKCGYIDSMAARLQSLGDDCHIKNLRFTGGFSARGDGYSSTYLMGEICGRQTYADIQAEKGGK